LKTDLTAVDLDDTNSIQWSQPRFPLSLTCPMFKPFDVQCGQWAFTLST
jgi:hypothetical protein